MNPIEILNNLLICFLFRQFHPHKNVFALFNHLFYICFHLFKFLILFVHLTSTLASHIFPSDNKYTFNTINILIKCIYLSIPLPIL